MTDALTAAEIMRDYTSAYSTREWEESKKSLLEDPHSGKVIRRLVGILEAEGTFREPVVIASPHVEGEVGSLIDGHHRVIAASFLPETLIKVIRTDEVEEDEITEMSFTTITRFGMEDISEEEEDGLWDSLLSFEVSEDFWAPAAIITSYPKAAKIEVGWNSLIPRLRVS